MEHRMAYTVANTISEIQRACQAVPCVRFCPKAHMPREPQRRVGLEECSSFWWSKGVHIYYVRCMRTHVDTS